jgi:hypothetical protein
MYAAPAWGSVCKIFLKEHNVFQKMCREFLPKPHWWGQVKTLFQQTGISSHVIRPACKPYAFKSAYVNSYFLWHCSPARAMASSFTRFLDHTQRRATAGSAPLDERSARRRNLYLTTHNTHNRKNIYAPGGIRTHDRSRRAAVNLRLRPRGPNQPTKYLTRNVP